MTHTNHRTGSSSSRRDDFIVLVMPSKGYNDDAESPDKLKRVFDVLMCHNPVNAGGINAGNLIVDSPAQIRENIGKDTPMIHGVYPSLERVNQAVLAIKDLNLGLSVVVTGLMDGVEMVAEAVGLTVHSIAYSLGIQGNRGLLPPDDVLEITSMCGHGLIPAALVEHLLNQLAGNRISIGEAVKRLGRNCVCGVFNPVRAARLLAEAAAERKGVERK